MGFLLEWMSNHQMNRLIKYVSLSIVGVSLFLSSWYVLHGDINFFTDIARDFHLFREIDEKKIVFLGPRSSTSGLFHGPLWSYVNYPAYLIGGGNPVVVGWYWIMLISLFLASSFYFAKKLFDERTGYLYIALLSLHLIFAANGLFNPYGAFFLIPAFYYFLVQFLKRNTYLPLLIHFFIGGCIVQFEMATGIPLLLLSSVVIVYHIFKTKKIQFLLCFFILLLPLSSFIIFDLRHDFLQTKAVFSYLSAGGSENGPDGMSYVLSRLKLIVSPGLQVFHSDLTGMRNPVIFMISAVFLYFAWKDNKRRLLFGMLMYLILGNYVLMLVNRSGDILYHYYMPISALTLLLFSSLSTVKKYRHVFLTVVTLSLLLNMQDAVKHIQLSSGIIGKHED